MKARRVRVAGGVEVVVDVGDAGTGVPCVLVHGLASNARLWDGVAYALRDLGHPVATVDQRGHGRADRPLGGYEFATVTDDLVAVLGALGWERPVVAGQSWGGNVVVELAARHPDEVRGIVGVDGGFLELAARFPDWESCLTALSPPDVRGTTATELEARIRARHPEWEDRAVAATLACYEVLGDGTVAPRLRRGDHLEILRHLWTHRPAERFAELAVPALLLVADDPSEPEWTAGKRRDVAAIQAAVGEGGANRLRIQWLRGDHDLHAQQPASVAAAMHQALVDGFFP